MMWLTILAKQMLRLLPCRVFYVFALSFLMLILYMVSFRSPKPIKHENISRVFSDTRNSQTLPKVYFGRSRILSSTAKTTITTAAPLPMNYNLKRPFCWKKRRNILLCPPLYTELGGECRYYGTKANCTDLRQFGRHRLRKAQLVITRLLGIFNLVARRHNITYWLSSGTLLGAVRHQGFIPWDDDADIEMTLDQYEKFYRYASRDLPDDVFFQNSESDPHLRPSDPLEYQRLKYKDIGLYKRLENPRLRDRQSCYTYCIQYDCRWHDGLMVDLFIHESLPNGTYPIKDYLFEGLTLPVASNWKQALTDKVGEDFMVFPIKNKLQFRRKMKTRAQPELACDEVKKRPRT